MFIILGEDCLAYLSSLRDGSTELQGLITTLKLNSAFRMYELNILNNCRH